MRRVILLFFVVVFCISCSKKVQEKERKKSNPKRQRTAKLIFSTEEQEYIKKLQKKGYARIGIEKEAGVYEIQSDGSIKGFDYGLVTYFCKLLQVKPRFVVIGFKDVFSVDGKIPSRIKKDKHYFYEPDIYKRVDWVASTITRLPWRKKIMNFIITMPTSVNLVGNKQDRITKIGDLNNKKIALVRNSSYELIMQRLEKQEKIKIHYTYVETGKKGSQKVLEGKVDFTLQDSNLLLLQIKDNKELDILMPVSNIQFLGWGVSKKRPILKSILNKLMNFARKNGTMDRLFRKVYGISMNT